MGEADANLSTALASTAQLAGQTGEMILPLATRPKIHVEKTKRPALQEDALTTKDLYHVEW